jgi:hypothetical protein
MSDDESRYILEELHSAGKDPKFTGELGPERQAVVDDILKAARSSKHLREQNKGATQQQWESDKKESLEGRQTSSKVKSRPEHFVSLPVVETCKAL